ncbi:alkaline phosphatase PafA [Paradesertivirga mongoliensis]|uniref:Alkaline phosphatase PafA n=1 Tax=Paradesertivirga mongoliensis TaxID=2100740 RepID=A0ABW4ZHP7_9SPHI|nr:alkaline phosphatase PafA [Pedobacter mongoliensis]
MKLKYCLLALLVTFYAASYSQQKSTSVPRPKLVVGLVVDQMRWDFLYRYFDRYGSGGFKRLIAEGFNCENTQITYIPTYTACGHASLYTGSVPSINGIAGNDWIEQNTGKRMYCTSDSTVTSVGTTSNAGKMSPRNMLTSTVADELKLATNFRSKAIGIALKDRGGILPAGHSADAAYWYDDLTGNWITSSYYRANLPQWVEAFNGQKLVEKYLTQKWTTLYPIETYKQSSPDNSPRYEGKYKNEEAPVFPHDIPVNRSSDWNTIRNTPFANTLTLDFAKAAVQNEKLGASGFTDFLAVSLSSTDYLGHQFGPNSVEVEDMYLRLDKDVADFLTYLDKAIGKGEYTLFLSADHGAAHNPNFLNDHKIPGGLWNGTNNSSRGLNELNDLLAKKYGSDKIVRNLFNYQVHFNYPLISEKGIDLSAVKKDVIAYYKSQKAVTYVVDLKNIGNEPIPDALKQRIINGYNEKRSGEIQIILNAGYYQGYGTEVTGTTHGTWNPYDTHIPLIFMGWGVKKGKTHRLVSMSDVAPTLSALLHIQEPNGNIGQPITEVLK